MPTYSHIKFWSLKNNCDYLLSVYHDTNHGKDVVILAGGILYGTILYDGHQETEINKEIYI